MTVDDLLKEAKKRYSTYIKFGGDINVYNSILEALDEKNIEWASGHHALFYKDNNLYSNSKYLVLNYYAYGIRLTFSDEDCPDGIIVDHRDIIWNARAAINSEEIFSLLL